MRTLGVDLSAGDRNTAAALIGWDGRPTLEELWPRDVSDELIVELAGKADVVAIDAPFGWPIPFAVRIAAYARGEAWPRAKPEGLWLRHTDERAQTVAGGRAPLSVSSDRIARTAARAARLLTLLGREDRPIARDGSDGVIEVYPAAALRCWQIDPGRYKDPSGLADRQRAVATIIAAIALGITDSDLGRLVAIDHPVDALVASVVGRAVHCGLAVAPTPDERPIARLEGWIWLPSGGLAALGAIR